MGTSRLLRSPWLARALASRSDLVLRAVADLLLENLGLLLDRAEAVLDGIVGGAEVGGDVANVDLGRGLRLSMSLAMLRPFVPV